jgi:excisionase family DNA binding protein
MQDEILLSCPDSWDDPIAESKTGKTISKHYQWILISDANREGLKMKDIMTVKEVALYLKLKPLAVYRKVAKDEIPHLRAGRSIRFNRDKIDHWLIFGWA